MNRIRETFARRKMEGKKVFIPYIMAGDLNLRETAERVSLLEECGADMVELGVPFSDPVADGPVIQRAAERALLSGTNLKAVITLAGELRKKTDIPLILMTYYNPVFRYGESRFAGDAVHSGIDGVIIPDLPPDEAHSLIATSRDHGLGTIFLVAPTSPEPRIRKAAASTSGFLYYVSMTGTTGSSLALEESFTAHITKVRSLTNKPLAIGFGVSGPEDARKVASYADGVIVGSAFVRMFHEKPESVRRFALSLREALD